MKHLTPEQEATTRPGQNIFVSASAGTGKTHVLTARVIRLMLTGTAPDRILCLTYTKAAAAVMENRIYKILGDWTLTPEIELRKKISAFSGESPDEEMVTRARGLFAEVLDIPGGLKIQTIHSFCQSLLMRFPIEARLTPNFKVLDDRTAAEFLKESSELVMDQAGEEETGELFDAFCQLSRQTNEEGFQNVLNSLLAKRGEILSLLETFQGPKGLGTQIFRDLGLDPGEKLEDIYAGAFAPNTFDPNIVRLLVDVLNGGTKTEKDLGALLGEGLENLQNPEVAFEKYQAVFLTQTKEPRAKTLNKANADAHPALVSFCEEEKVRVRQILDRMTLLRVAQNTQALLKLGITILQVYQNKKAAFGVLDYDDLIFKTRDLLNREGIAPWILYKLDAAIEHILVDEAQDTNRVQWSMIEVLSQEFFSGLGTKEIAARTVFAVGDVKQSIYGFQGAEPEELNRALRRVQTKAEAAGLVFRDRKLGISFRSTQIILNVVDQVFSLPETANGIRNENEIIRHKAHRLGASGLVEVWPLELPEEKKEKPSGWTLPFEQSFTPKPEAKLASKIARHIFKMVENGEILKARKRPVRYGDIMVLVQRRGAFMAHLIRELKALGAPVAGSDRMKLSEQIAVNDLLALARFSLLPEDDFSLAVTLKSPLLNLDDTHLMDLAIDRPGSLWKALQTKGDKSATYHKARDFLRAVLEFVDFGTPFEFFSRILGPMGGRKNFAKRLGHEVIDPLDEFLSLCQEFETNHTPSLQGFLKWFSSSETEVKRDMESGRNEVRILTIHGAKGLEAPIVYLPDTYRQKRRRPDSLLNLESGVFVWPGEAANEVGLLRDARTLKTREEEAEQNRLLYVALTRAEDRLYVMGWRGPRASKDSDWYERIFGSVATLEGVEKIEERTGTRLRLETPQEAPSPEEEEEPIKPQGAKNIPDWALRPAPKETGLETLSPSKAEGGLSLVPGEFAGGREKSILKGNVIHKLLEVLPDLPSEKRNPAMTAYLNFFSHKLSSDEQREIAEKVKSILEDRTFLPLFQPGSRAEVSLAGRVDKTFFAGEVDRIAVTDKEIFVIDYKSNRQVPKNLDEVPKGYIRQLGLYSSLLKGIYPGKKIRAALLWTEDASLMELPSSLLECPP